MHKLKNKHTGEVITTPYLAEVEEYLKSGDYEMSENKYPYIGESELTGCDYVVYSDGCFYSIGAGKFHDNINQENLKNITREYLANTYGKCESQEYADFICKLAENAGFTYINDYNSIYDHFWFDIDSIEFDEAKEAIEGLAKPISIPLPPKENKVAETKPVYTKEMHERGELPPVGSYFVMSDIPNHVWFSKFNGLHCKVLALTEYENGVVVTFDSEKEGFGALWHYEGMEPLPTIENELSEIWDNEPDKHSIINAIIAKYNITPKE